MDEETAAIKLQCAYRGHLALKKVRNAAKDIYVKETDPERKKKIWNQYRKYKNLPLED